jgi:hypothetical protein
MNFLNSRGAMSANFSGLHTLFSNLKTMLPISLCRAGRQGGYIFTDCFGDCDVGPGSYELHTSDQEVAAKFGNVSDDHKAHDEQHSG